MKISMLVVQRGSSASSAKAKSFMNLDCLLYKKISSANIYTVSFEKKSEGNYYMFSRLDPQPPFSIVQ